MSGFKAPRLPLNLAGRAFGAHKYETYRWLLEHAPVCRGRIGWLRFVLVARYEDCQAVLADPRLLRNRGRARGRGGPLPFPLPKNVAALAKSMIVEDDPEHRRLRNLVNKAFTRRAVTRLEARVEADAHALLDRLPTQDRVDLLKDYARPIPTSVIAEMVGVSKTEVDRLKDTLRVLSDGFSGWGLVRTLFVDLRRTGRFLRELIEKKRGDPGEDILSDLIRAEEDGDRLSADELVSLVFLLIIAGFETTQHLIANGVAVLLEHPESWDALRRDPSLMGSAVEEILRFRGPIHGTKPQYATQDFTLEGERISRGTAVMPLLGAANRDPAVFDDPDEFRVTRTPNRHLSFGFGRHFCLGAQLARMEAAVALRVLLERSPELRLAGLPGSLELANTVGWHRYTELPVVLGKAGPDVR